MTRYYSLAAAVLLCCTVSTPALAQNMRYLKNSPIERMTAADMEIYKQAVRDAFENAEDAEISIWKNEETGAAGMVKPLNTTMDGGSKCRLIEFYHSAGPFSGGGARTLCEQPDGRLKFK